MLQSLNQVPSRMAFSSPDRQEDHLYESVFNSSSILELVTETLSPLAGRKPSTLTGGVWLQKASSAPSLEHGLTAANWENKDCLSSVTIERYKTVQGMIELNQEGIDIAIDRRVALFFQQAITCFRMPFTFSTGAADDQVGSACSLTLTQEFSGVKYSRKRQAAHSSTLPTLLVRVETTHGTKFYTYLKNKSHHATIAMDASINKTDTLLDGKGNEDGLRAQAVAILNLVGKAELDPIEATKAFLQSFNFQLRKKHGQLSDQDERKYVLLAYTKGLQEISQSMIENECFFDQLLGVMISPRDKDIEMLRPCIYKRRYEAIQYQGAFEGLLRKTIQEYKDKLSLDSDQIEHLLLKAFIGDPDCKAVEKLLGKTTVYLEENQAILPAGPWKAFRTRMNTLYVKNQSSITGLKVLLKTKFKRLREVEVVYRLQLCKDLCVIRKWDARECRHQYQVKTGKAIPQSRLSIDGVPQLNVQDVFKKIISQDLRSPKDCAVTFDIDPNLMQLHWITSEE